MGMTIKESWKLRNKVPKYIQTYEQALCAYEYAKACAGTSRAGGHHHGRNVLSSPQAATRQYPVLTHEFGKTFVGMLATTVNASNLDDVLYTSNNQVPEGRIVFYYAPGGGYYRQSCRLHNSLEVVMWCPDGRCLVAASAAEPYQYGIRDRAEQFAGITIGRFNAESLVLMGGIRGDRGRGIYTRVQKPASELSPGVRSYHRVYMKKQADGTEVEVYDDWERDLRRAYYWNEYRTIFIPKKRAQRPYFLRGTSQVGPGVVGDEGSNLTSVKEAQASHRRRVSLERKVRGTMQSLRNNRNLMRYFVNNFRHELVNAGVDLPRTTQEQLLAEAHTILPPSAEFLGPGERHARRLLIDGEEDQSGGYSK